MTVRSVLAVMVCAFSVAMCALRTVTEVKMVDKPPTEPSPTELR